MPRQNEEVNEIWLCDKGRFTYDYAVSTERLTQPLLRKDGELTPVSWEEALTAAAEKVKAAGSNLVTLVSGRVSSEDMLAAKTLAKHTASKIALYSTMGGGEWVARVGMTAGSNLGNLQKGSVILVIGSDLHQEAPLWWLRVKQAAQRGVTLIVANARKTRLDKFATLQRRYDYGEAADALRELFQDDEETSKLFSNAENLVIFYGSDGMGLSHTSALAEVCAEYLVKTDHFGRANNGLIPVWPHANDQAAYELGIQPDADLVSTINNAMGLYLVGVDPAADDPLLKDAVQRAGFVIVQELFLTETAKLADVVFPAQAAVERSGTYISGERRAQYFGAAVPALKGTKADHRIISELLQHMGHPALPQTDKDLFTLAFANNEFAKMLTTKEQWPVIGDSDAYYGGTASRNTFGLGMHLHLAGGRDVPARSAVPAKIKVEKGEWLAVPVNRLYDRGQLMTLTPLLMKRVPEAAVVIHPNAAKNLELADGSTVTLKIADRAIPGSGENSTPINLRACSW